MKTKLIAIALLLAGMAPAVAQAPSGTPNSATAEEPAPAPEPPLVLLLDGLGVYIENDYIGVSALARPLQEQGFRTRTDSHLMTKTQGLVPDIIIGHSMGGETALRYSRSLARAGYPAPLVITVDAAPAPPACAVPRCINIAGPGFAQVRGATNISAWASGARFTSHAQLPTHPAVRQLILKETGAWMASRRAALVAANAAAGKPGKKPAPPSTAQAPAASAPAPAPSQSWSLPGWSVPNWQVPGWTVPGVTGRGG
ncbi:hypothetical protein MWN33_10910 [Starkeya koreensis]|uniref:Alpha/beta hydrolase n=1 Tax=Ancylobacter koreensis TaxID=266121 RepID=A0ABT0DMN6_9HYPH|nr:hypothetical protein [Ancylobacter koreensis]MCK0208541.1 hypothetical protein [Ancylobacter koreensis]